MSTFFISLDTVFVVVVVSNISTSQLELETVTFKNTAPRRANKKCVCINRELPTSKRLVAPLLAMGL